MSIDTHSSAPSPSPNNIAKDIILWRRRTMTVTLLTTATTTLVLMQVYQFKFLTVFSWLAMLLLACLFLWANLRKLFGRAPPSLSALELTEESALQMANSVREWSEEGIRWMFRVSAEEGWPLFLGVVSGLWVLSQIASRMNLLTFLYTGVIVGTTVPITYVKNKDRIRSIVGWLKAKCKRSYEIFDERTVQKIKSRMTSENEMKKKSEKKAE